MSGHVAPKSLTTRCSPRLIFGTFLTVVVARIDLGVFNNVAMLGIAVAKASLVVLFFMHVRWSTRLTWVVVGAGHRLAAHPLHVHDERLPDARVGGRHAQITFGPSPFVIRRSGAPPFARSAVTARHPGGLHPVLSILDGAVSPSRWSFLHV